MSTEDLDLRNRVVVVTGGAGILGKEICKVLSKVGALVILVDQSPNLIEKALEELDDSIDKGNLISIQSDISNAESVTELISKIESEVGPIYGLVNNAATKGSIMESFYKPFEEYDIVAWQEIMDVNVNGSFLMAKEVGSRMKERRLGNIVQVASIYGIVAPDQRLYFGSKYEGLTLSSPAVYATSKAAVIGLARYLAAYWGEFGIRVNSISPGGIFSGQNQAFVDNYTGKVPLKRMANTNDISSTVLFLLSNASCYITGQNIVVDGGFTCW